MGHPTGGPTLRSIPLETSPLRASWWQVHTDPTAPHVGVPADRSPQPQVQDNLWNLKLPWVGAGLGRQHCAQEAAVQRGRGSNLRGEARSPAG